jgi:hypothetical protein
MELQSIQEKFEVHQDLVAVAVRLQGSLVVEVLRMVGLGVFRR